MLTDFQILHHGPGQEDAEWPYECQLYFGREIEKDVRAEVKPLVQQLREASSDLLSAVSARPSCQAGVVARCCCLECAIGRVLGAKKEADAWLAEQPQEAPHATPA